MIVSTKERVYELTMLFYDLQTTNSITEKREFVAELPSELKEDFEYILECLAGMHPFGFTYNPICIDDVKPLPWDYTIKQILEYLQEPKLKGDLSQANIAMHVARTFIWCDFFEPIVNRTLKLGIGKSILPKDGLSAMLAKKYEGNIKHSKGGYFITEKLDGNRCIAHWDGTQWVFTSRNGKPMHVNFDMSDMPKEYVYDGEILAPQQVEMSNAIYNMIVNGEGEARKFQGVFNSTSGLINRHTTNKQLVYNIFDIMLDDTEYTHRRNELDGINSVFLSSKDVRILPCLARFNDADELNANAGYILDKVVNIGGEGLMINIGDGKYTHKRTDALLKYKQVQTMDMEVVGVQWGTGKYDGAIGALNCKIVTDDGKIITCDVGSGLSDEQRWRWALNPDGIIGKIVEIAYFSMSQSKNTYDSNKYSLRFPRLKSVRKDKVLTSEH